MWQYEPKICDFGCAVHTGDETRNTFCCTPDYVPPEMARGEAYNKSVIQFSN